MCYFWGMHAYLAVFLGLTLGFIPFLQFAGEAVRLPANAIASAAPTKEICRRGDHVLVKEQGEMQP